MQGDLNWLRERQKGIGGSDVATILGLNAKYKTPLDVYYEKIAPEPIIKEETVKMKRGKQMEDTIARIYSEETGNPISVPPEIIWDTEIPYFFSSLDRYTEIEGVRGILECKNTTSQYRNTWENSIPDYFMCQAQHQLQTTKLPFVQFAILVDGWDLIQHRVEPDPDYLRIQNKKLIEFWENNVLKGVPPDPINTEDIERLYPDTLSEAVDFTEDSYKLLQKLIKIKKAKKFIEEKEKEFATAVQLVLLDKEIGKYNGNVVVTWKRSKDSDRFDTKTFQSENKELYKKYIKQQKGNRMLLPKE